MNVLFISWDGPQVSYLEGLFLPIFRALKTHGIQFVTPTPEDLLVFYEPDPQAWQSRCRDMLAAGFAEAEPFNPYWATNGRTFEDPDGYRVVIQQARWVGRADPPSPAAARS